MLKFLANARSRASSNDRSARGQSSERGVPKPTNDAVASEHNTIGLHAATIAREALFGTAFGSGRRPSGETHTGTLVERPPVSYPRIVHLNVGGKKYTTALTTLLKDSSSKLYEMFSGLVPPHRDKGGVFYIDRDGRVFHHILNWLRDGSVPIGLSRVDRLELLRETKFYRLGLLHELLGGVQQPHDHSWDEFTRDARTSANQRNALNDGRLLSEKEQRSFMESFDFIPASQYTRTYARLRYGHEYPGDWIVSSPRNLPDVDYDLYEATLGRDLIPAMNRMVRAGFKPCDTPPNLPKVSEYHTDKWQLMMYKDTPAPGCLVGYDLLDFPPVSSKLASSVTSRASTGAL